MLDTGLKKHAIQLFVSIIPIFNKQYALAYLMCVCRWFCERENIYENNILII